MIASGVVAIFKIDPFQILREKIRDEVIFIEGFRFKKSCFHVGFKVAELFLVTRNLLLVLLP